MASWSIEGYNMLMKYEQEGLGGILQEYPQEFIILERVVKKVVDNMIFIGNNFQNIKASEYLDELEDLQEIKPDSISSMDEVEDLHKKFGKGLDSSEESEGEDTHISRKYHFKLEPSSSKLVRVDEDTQIEVEYPINLNLPSYSLKLCELRDSKILIVGVSGKYSQNTVTYRYDLKTFECISLGNMKIPRSGYTLFYYDGKVYTFGGYTYYNEPICISDIYSRIKYIDNYKAKNFSQAEVMEWNDKEWRSLPDMHTVINEPFCYVKGSKIYLFGSNSLEYLDLTNDTFYLIGNYGIPWPSKSNIVEDDDYIYILADNNITILNSSFEYQASLSKAEDRIIRMVKFQNGAIFGASTPANCLKLHNPISSNYRVLKTIIFNHK